MIDGGKLYDWLEKQDVDLTYWHDGDSMRMSRREFAELFRAYVAELTDG